MLAAFMKASPFWFIVILLLFITNWFWFVSPFLISEQDTILFSLGVISIPLGIWITFKGFKTVFMYFQERFK